MQFHGYAVGRSATVTEAGPAGRATRRVDAESGWGATCCTSHVTRAEGGITSLQDVGEAVRPQREDAEGRTRRGADERAGHTSTCAITLLRWGPRSLRQESEDGVPPPKRVGEGRKSVEERAGVSEFRRAETPSRRG